MSGFKLLTRYIQFRQQLVLILLIVHFIVFGGLFERVWQGLFIYVEFELCTTKHTVYKEETKNKYRLAPFPTLAVLGTQIRAS
jgi:hypothetical protein